MASPSVTTPDTLVTLKVNLDGTTRRFKLPLRDLGASTLEPKLRTLLAIPKETEAVLERYSDSAAAYVVLDPSNISIYKQLYRAAKAKQKLKLRLTTTTKHEQIPEEKKGPKPASVEDEPEAERELSQSTPPAAVKAEVPQPRAVPTPSADLSAICRALEVSTKATDVQLRHSLACMNREQKLMERNLEQIEASVAALKLRPVMSAASQSPAVRTLLAQAKQTHEAMKASLKSVPSVEFPVATTSAPTRSYGQPSFAVYCNSCDRTIPGAHYHCSTCDDGDFDLCQACVDRGISCHGAGHWLIKRLVEGGVFVNSTTERIPPKPKAEAKPVEQKPLTPISVPRLNELLYSNNRTCNNCIKELRESQFVHCTTCKDFDLCNDCIVSDHHGHHPKHAFVPAVEGTSMSDAVTRRLASGRAQEHTAICDGCDKRVAGVRHKCLDCPDWDYCSSCVQNAAFIHPGHRFVPIYESLESNMSIRARFVNRAVHYGISCDGPLCTTAAKNGVVRHITGDRYKCAVCNDTDFCASCEASPANTHNRTHPLIKFKTPVRSVSVSTTGEHGNGQPLPVLGDRLCTRPASTSSRATETNNQGKNFATSMQTVVDMEPSAPTTPVKDEEKEVEVEEKAAPVEKVVEKDLVAVFARDTVADGTVMAPNTVFEQTWVLRNEGDVAWPAGCSVKFVSGDYMGHLEPDHPAAIGELVSSSESTISYNPVEPGQEASFTVLLRSPLRGGRHTSNWRLTTKDGLRFGHRLWCDLVVQSPEEVAVKEEPKAEDAASVKTQESQMIFPKLDKESPVSSIHEASHSDSATAREEEYEDCAEDDEWAEDESDSGFLTDEEYDILDASDEEFLEGQQKSLHK